MKQVCARNAGVLKKDTTFKSTDLIFFFQLCFDYPKGYFQIDGCEGVNPTLYLTVGRTYLFDQSDDSNWYHLIGFACKLLESIR